MRNAKDSFFSKDLLAQGSFHHPSPVTNQQGTHRSFSFDKFTWNYDQASSSNGDRGHACGYRPYHWASNTNQPFMYNSETWVVKTRRLAFPGCNWWPTLHVTRLLTHNLLTNWAPPQKRWAHSSPRCKHQAENEVDDVMAHSQGHKGVRSYQNPVEQPWTQVNWETATFN